MKNVKIIIILMIVIELMVAGCLNDEDNDDEDKGELIFTEDNYPTVDGSTSTHPLAVLISCKMLDIPYKWEQYYDDTRRIVPEPTESSQEPIAENITKKVVHYGTHSSYENLINEKVDLILVARLPSDDELELANDMNVQLEAEAVALDAFVFIVNIDNPIESFTSKQVRDIYTGNITNWASFDENVEEINAYQRNDNSGSQELMESLVMKDLTMIDAPDMILYGMMGPINILSTDENGIGYSVYFFEEFMAPNEKIKLCALNGDYPTYETIKSRSYIYTTEVFVVIREDQDQKSEAYELREWLLTSEGQEVVKESGYVPAIYG